MPSNNIDLELRAEPVDDAMILYCKGQIMSGDTSGILRSAVIDLFHRHHNIVVDLGGVHCMDRGGLETLVGLYASARTAKARVKYVNLTIEVSDSQPQSNKPHKLAS